MVDIENPLSSELTTIIKKGNNQTLREFSDQFKQILFILLKMHSPGYVFHFSYINAMDSEFRYQLKDEEIANPPLSK